MLWGLYRETVLQHSLNQGTCRLFTSAKKVLFLKCTKEGGKW